LCMLLLGTFAKEKKHDQYYLFVQFKCSRKFRIKPPWILVSGAFYNDPTLHHRTWETLSFTCIQQSHKKIASPRYKRVWFFSHKKLQPIIYMCDDINFVVSSITVDTGCQIVMFIATYNAM
jgi:hypothetical protein